MKDDQIRVVVRNVRTDRNVAVVAVPGTFDWGGWNAPPVALVGHRVYVGTNDQTEVVNWRTGRARTSATLPGSWFPDVRGTHAVVEGTHATKVIEVASGKVLLRVAQKHRDAYVQLSPDGRFATTSGDRRPGPSSTIKVHDLRRDTTVRLGLSDGGQGWSADGTHVYQVSGSRMTTCHVTTGTCHTTRIPAVSQRAFVRYPGTVYES